MLPFIIQFGLNISCRFQQYRGTRKMALIYSINPMVGVIDGFRWAIIGVTPIYTGRGYSSIGIATLRSVTVSYFSDVCG